MDVVLLNVQMRCFSSSQPGAGVLTFLAGELGCLQMIRRDNFDRPLFSYHLSLDEVVDNAPVPEEIGLSRQGKVAEQFYGFSMSENMKDW